jgi:hypothetical protein
MHVYVSLWVTLVLRERGGQRDEMLRDHLKSRQKVFVNVLCVPFKGRRDIIIMNDRE